MRRPGKEIENFDWEAARFKAPIDPEKFRKQHDGLAQVYKDHGVRVHYIEEQREDRPNALFCRDLLLMTPEGSNCNQTCDGSKKRRRTLHGKGFGRPRCSDYPYDMR